MPTIGRARGALEQEVLACLAAAGRPLHRGRGARPIWAAGSRTPRCMTDAEPAARQGRADAASTPGAPTPTRWPATPASVGASVTARRMRRLLEAGADRAGVLARFVADLPPEDERLLADLLADGRPARRSRLGMTVALVPAAVVSGVLLGWSRRLAGPPAATRDRRPAAHRGHGRDRAGHRFRARRGRPAGRSASCPPVAALGEWSAAALAAGDCRCRPCRGWLAAPPPSVAARGTATGRALARPGPGAAARPAVGSARGRRAGRRRGRRSPRPTRCPGSPAGSSCPRRCCAPCPPTSAGCCSPTRPRTCAHRHHL